MIKVLVTLRRIGVMFFLLGQGNGQENIQQAQINTDSLDEESIQQSLILVEGKDSMGSGFVIKKNGINHWVTNAHVLSGIESFQLKTLNGKRLKPLSFLVSVENDIAMGKFEGEAMALEVCETIEKDVRIGDAVAVYGNSDGEGVITKLTGRINGIGADLIEVDAEFLPGNSGSPIIHINTGKVVGIATFYTYPNLDRLKEDAKFDGKLLGELGKKVRRFGYRVDSTDARWQAPRWRKFVEEARKLREMEERTIQMEMIAMSGIRISRVGQTFTYIPEEQRLKTLTKSFNDHPSNKPEASFRAFETNLESFVRSMLNETWHEFRILSKNDFTAYHQKEFKNQESYRKALRDFYDQWLIEKF